MGRTKQSNIRTRGFGVAVFVVSVGALGAPERAWGARALETGGEPRAAAQLYSLGTSGVLHSIDPGNGTSLSSVPVAVSAETVVNGNGLTSEPSTGALWGLLTLLGQSGRELVTIEPSSGVATRIGNTGQLFAALAFDDVGTLYGLSGTPPPGAILHRLDRTTAAAESVLALTNAGGHAMAFNPDDGLLYHATGGLLEKVDLDLLTITPVPTSGHPWFAGQGMTYAAGGSFLFTASFGQFLNLTVSGRADSLGTTPNSKGLAFSPVGTGTGTQDAPSVALRAWPNPFSKGQLHVSFLGLFEETPRVEIFDVAGRLVRALSPSARGPSEHWTWGWDGRDGEGRSLPAGIYLLRLCTLRTEESARVVLLR
jgi:hypothetical protein